MEVGDLADGRGEDDEKAIGLEGLDDGAGVVVRRGKIENGMGEEGLIVRLGEAGGDVFVDGTDMEVDGGEVECASELANETMRRPRVLRIAIESV